ncbi:MAG: hypothetical protein K2K59_04725, partial [Muribaculaceae bacterium]|nr:hypothetical protein [Muribaculaceae bacterium]
MESNQNGEQRKPKRPRIGAIPNPGNDPESRFEKVNYGSDYNSTPRPEGEGNGEQQYSRPYQPRPRYNQHPQGEARHRPQATKPHQRLPQQ